MTAPNLEQIATQWRAEEHATQARAAAQVEALQASEAPAAPQASPSDAKAREEAEKARQLEAAAAAALPMLCAIAWRMVDKGVQSFGGAHCAATEDELQQLATLTVPVLDKYLPGGLAAVLKTPEGVLLGTAALIYGVKMLQGAPVVSPPTPPAAPPSPAPEASA